MIQYTAEINTKSFKKNIDNFGIFYMEAQEIFWHLGLAHSRQNGRLVSRLDCWFSLSFTLIFNFFKKSFVILWIRAVALSHIRNDLRHCSKTTVV